MSTAPSSGLAQLSKRRGTALSTIAAILLGGCAAAGSGQGPAEIPVPAAFHEAGSPAAARADESRWWERLGDPLLADLVEQARSGNLDLAVARARLKQSRETEIQARAGRFPSLEAGGTASHTEPSDGAARTTLSLSGDASYEVDLFGGTAASIEAARAGTDAARHDLAAIHVSLAAEVARAYVQARQAQEQASIAGQLLRFARSNLEIARWRNQAGLVSALDVEQARGEAAQAEAAVPVYRQDYSTAVHRLGVLLGLAPGALHEKLDEPRPVPAAPASISAGIPLDTLRHRPDVVSAERSLDAEVARIGVTRAELYPRLRLGGSIGGTGTSMSQLVDGLATTVFASLSQLLFDGGRSRSQVRSQEAAAEAALASYRQTVLVALEEVENALVAWGVARERIVSLREAQEAAENQAVLTRVSYRSGLVDFTTLLAAERALATAQNSLAQSKAGETLAAIQLYRALGGGWSEEILQEDAAND